MREQLRDSERLKHIQTAINNLVNNSSKYSLEELLADPIAYYGFVKLVEIIGEATYKLTKEYRADHPEVPWDVMEKMRHILVHDYYSINPAQLWDTVKIDIPEIKPLIDSLIDE